MRLQVVWLRLLSFKVWIKGHGEMCKVEKEDVDVGSLETPTQHNFHEANTMQAPSAEETRNVTR